MGFAPFSFITLGDFYLVSEVEIGVNKTDEVPIAGHLDAIA